MKKKKSLYIEKFLPEFMLIVEKLREILDEKTE